MSGISRCSPFISVCQIVLISTILTLLIPFPAKADVGVAPVLPGGSNLQPVETTPIQMAVEVVTINVRSATQVDNESIALNPDAYGYPTNKAWFRVTAEVNADFTMRNPTSEPVTMLVWFPLASTLDSVAWNELNPDEIVPRIQRFMVAINSTPVDHTVSELPNPDGPELPNLPWASFPVTFPANQDTRIQIGYVFPLSQPAKLNALVLYYVFQTGAGWAGPIGQAELILKLPYPASPETLSGMPASSLRPPYFIYMGKEIVGIPAGAALEDNQARWTWQNWEPGPQDDFAILLLPPQTWYNLQSHRAAVAYAPGNGQAWWKLCQAYYGLSRTYHAGIKPAYVQVYPSLGIEACQKAADLIPGDAAPHYVLASFHLAALEKSPSLQTLEPALRELKLAVALEAGQQPTDFKVCDSWGEVCNAEFIEPQIANAFPGTLDHDWIATIDEEVNRLVTIDFIKATAAATGATQTAQAAATATLIPSATPPPTLEPTLTPYPSPTQAPSETSQPSPTATSAPAETDRGSQNSLLMLAAGVIGLILAGYLGYGLISKPRSTR